MSVSVASECVVPTKPFNYQQSSVNSETMDCDIVESNPKANAEQSDHATTSVYDEMDDMFSDLYDDDTPLDNEPLSPGAIFDRDFADYKDVESNEEPASTFHNHETGYHTINLPGSERVQLHYPTTLDRYEEIGTSGACLNFRRDLVTGEVYEVAWSWALPGLATGLLENDSLDFLKFMLFQVRASIAKMHESADEEALTRLEMTVKIFSRGLEQHQAAKNELKWNRLYAERERRGTISDACGVNDKTVEVEGGKEIKKPEPSLDELVKLLTISDDREAHHELHSLLESLKI